jgi:hypothetical protein
MRSILEYLMNSNIDMLLNISLTASVEELISQTFPAERLTELIKSALEVDSDKKEIGCQILISEQETD